jgi:hypothetical protein
VRRSIGRLPKDKKTVETVEAKKSGITTQLKLGVNEKTLISHALEL